MSISYLLGRLNLRAFRYCVLVTFLVCSALVSSVAVWNLGLVNGVGIANRSSLLGMDAYLTFLGCSGLVLLFVIAFIEIAHKCWSIATVWFECVWVSLWGLMYFAAGIALTVIESQEDCSTTDGSSRCVSAQVLLAFTWLCAVTLLIYFSTFMFAVFINKKKDPTIWHSIMRKFPWSGTCAILASAPPTPTLPRFQNTVPIIKAPKPKHARPGNTGRAPIFSWRSGLSHEYHIEHYRPPTVVQPVATRAADRPRAAALPALPTPALPSIEMETPENNFASSLYPFYMQRAIIIANSEPAHPEPASTHVPAGVTTRVARPPAHTSLPASPPPLGNWPRSDIIAQPPMSKKSKGKRKAPPVEVSGDLGASTSPSGSRPRERGVNPGGTGQSTAPSSFPPARPVGPRRKSGSSEMARPPVKYEYA
ncbi:hypothetical protein P691DRAFT_720042 [Macrolepiota fuliginosa MF-IS2]|uniref:MARVEL domain-containing protein n=1 Tax=Macrolepiota fuliginosa MF-IS2 TaxID=1400762 RepID=A0A9P6C8T0_9AGAR|nr:hypothetical protein P691DRAFT_720042 [Macrolepiota fuliginosa MF-IS2]